MEKIKTELLKLKPWFIIITFAGLVYLVVNNFFGILGTIGNLLGYLQVFFYGLIMAFVINIPMTFIERVIQKYLAENNFLYKHARGISIFIAVIFVFILLSLIVSIIFPEIVESILRIVNNLGNYFNALVYNLDSILAYFHVDNDVLSSWNIDTLLAFFGLNYATLVKNITDIIVGTGTGTIVQLINFGSMFFNLIMAFFICLYLLGSKETFIRQAKKIIVVLFPKDFAAEILKVLSTTNHIFKEFIGGKLLEMVIVWIMMYISLMIFKVPYVTLISSLCALAVFIPYFGALVISIIAVILLLSVNPIQALVFFIIYQVVQNIDGNLIYPKIMGNATGLPAVWILVSVFFFGGLFGPFGMLIAVPVTACIYVFISQVVRRILIQRRLNITEDTKAEDLV